MRMAFEGIEITKDVSFRSVDLEAKCLLWILFVSNLCCLCINRHRYHSNIVLNHTREQNVYFVRRENAIHQNQKGMIADGEITSETQESYYCRNARAHYGNLVNSSYGIKRRTCGNRNKITKKLIIGSINCFGNRNYTWVLRCSNNQSQISKVNLYRYICFLFLVLKSQLKVERAAENVIWELWRRVTYHGSNQHLDFSRYNASHICRTANGQDQMNLVSICSAIGTCLSPNSPIGWSCNTTAKSKVSRHQCAQIVKICHLGQKNGWPNPSSYFTLSLCSTSCMVHQFSRF